MRLSELSGIGPRDLFRRAWRSYQFRLAEREWRVWQVRFAAAAPENLRRDFSTERLPEVQVFSFSGARDLPLQILSLLSFLRHVGIPESWTIASDGSLSDADTKRLKAIHPCVRVRPWRNFITPENRAAVELYAEDYPLGKKLALITALPAGTSIYVDSDVLFFSGAPRLRQLLAESPENHYLRDIGNVVVEGLATAEERALIPLNSGFLIQKKSISWAGPLERVALLRKQGAFTEISIKHYVEQTVAHIGYHASGAQMLDPRYYVIEFDDAFEPNDRFSGPEIVLRHYVCHTRLKLWGRAAEYLEPTR